RARNRHAAGAAGHAAGLAAVIVVLHMVQVRRNVWSRAHTRATLPWIQAPWWGGQAQWSIGSWGRAACRYSRWVWVPGGRLTCGAKRLRRGRARSLPDLQPGRMARAPGHAGAP